MATFHQAKDAIVVESVTPLTSAAMIDLLRQLNLDPDTVELTNRPNPLLIAGIRIFFHGKMIDLSFRHQLNQLSR